MGHNKKGASMKSALAFIAVVAMAAVVMIASAGLDYAERPNAGLLGPTVVQRVTVVVPVEKAVDALTDAANVWKLDISGMGSGTAFPIACEPTGAYWRISFLTAKHCTLEPGTVLPGGLLPWYSVKHDDGRKLSLGRLVSVHPKEDAAILSFISMKPVFCRMLDFKAPAFGERLFLCGYPMGQGPYLTEGFASGGRRFSASGFPGSSGGPVTRPNGSVCAIIVAGHGTQFQFVDFMLYHVPLNSVEKWLRLYL